MKKQNCKKCGSEWNSSIVSSSCPFCGAQIKYDTDNMNISEVIKYVITNKGEEILNDYKIVYSYVLDLVRSHEREKKLFYIACVNKSLNDAYDIVKADSKEQRDIIIAKSIKRLEENAFLSTENAVSAMNIILEGIGVATVENINKKLNQPMEIQSQRPETLKKVHNNVNLENQYNSAVELLEKALKEVSVDKLERANILFQLLEGYKDSEKRIALCSSAINKIKYNNAMKEKEKIKDMNDVYMIESTAKTAKYMFETLNDYKDCINQAAECENICQEQIYRLALSAKDSADKYQDQSIYSKAVMLFGKLADYKDSKTQLVYCQEQLKIAHTEYLYRRAIAFSKSNDEFSLKKAVDIFEELKNWKDSETLCKKCREKIADLHKISEKKTLYKQAIELSKSNNEFSLKKAVELFEKIIDWEDSKQFKNKCIERIDEIRINERKRNGVCQYCGGVFIKKFLRPPVCQKCGKIKDY